MTHSLTGSTEMNLTNQTKVSSAGRHIRSHAGGRNHWGKKKEDLRLTAGPDRTQPSSGQLFHTVCRH